MASQGHVKRRSTTEAVEKPVKRTRVSRACDQCRIAREKCDGLQPACSTCSATKRKCAYTANPKKRGIQPGYIRTLELALAWIFLQNPENETALNEKLQREGASSLFLSRDSKDSNKLHNRWRKSRFHSDVDKLLSGTELSRQESSEHFSLQSDDESSDAEDTPLNESKHILNDNANLNLELGLTVPSDSQLSLLPTLSASAQTTISLPPDSWKFLDTYFVYTQTWLPICEKYDILKLSYSYPSQGLSLIASQSDSGAHAELWSVLALGSLQDQMSTRRTGRPSTPSMTPEQIYDHSRSIIPNELGSFDLGHIKAFLNLAVFNMVQSIPEAAWILLGCACRILEVGDQSKFMENPRHKHVFSGCFLLDNMLALQLNRRPHFQMHDLELIGKIDEDGIEEWQPWNNQSGTGSLGQRKTPILGLSTFNNLLQIVDVLAGNGQPSATGTNEHDIGTHLKVWRGSLPLKLNYLLSDTVMTPFNPPAVLLQMTYYSAALVSTLSTLWLHRILDLLEQCQERIGLTCLPPIIDCLMVVVRRQIARLPLDEITKTRLQTIQLCLLQAQAPRSKNRVPIHDTPGISSKPSAAVIQISTPESMQFPLTMTQSRGQQVGANTPQAISPETSGFIPRTHSSIPSDRSFDPLLIAPDPPPSDPQYSEVPSELESFFDELASLDRTTRSNNQPQFMQNLGFAPNASMADLFSEYIPIQSEAFIPRDVADASAFDQYDFYGPS